MVPIPFKIVTVADLKQWLQATDKTKGASFVNLTK